VATSGPRGLASRVRGHSHRQPRLGVVALWRTRDGGSGCAGRAEKWEELPVRYVFDWMALWPLLAMALASQRIEQAAECARGMLPAPQQPLQEPARTLVDSAVHAWDNGQPAETEELLHRAVQAAADLGYL